jgi:hypothetical protein
MKLSETTRTSIQALMGSIANVADQIGHEAGAALAHFDDDSLEPGLDPALIAKGGTDILIRRAEAIIAAARAIRCLE